MDLERFIGAGIGSVKDLEQIIEVDFHYCSSSKYTAPADLCKPRWPSATIIMREQKVRDYDKRIWHYDAIHVPASQNAQSA